MAITDAYGINSISTDDWDALKDSWNDLSKIDVTNITSTTGLTTSYGTGSRITDIHHIIQGEMLTALYTVPGVNRINEDDVKKALIQYLADEIFNKNMIEFTKLSNHAQLMTEYRARIFVTPNDQVQLLRTNGVK